MKQVFNGEAYHGGNGHYYRNVRTGTSRYLHREVWAATNGPIPEGHHIHHIDGNKDNNDLSNLECKEAKKHISEHSTGHGRGFSEAALKKAADWHRSEEGSAWHKEHGKNVFGNQKRVQLTCIQCGKVFDGVRAKFCDQSCKVRNRLGKVGGATYRVPYQPRK